MQPSRELCHKPDGSRFYDAVRAAVGEDGVIVTNPEAFRDAVVASLRANGYCAVKGGPDDEVGVKLANDYSEQYDVISGAGRTQVYHAATCSPARF